MSISIGQNTHVNKEDKVKTIEALRKLQQETKAEVYLVGGFVRDLLRKKKSNDLDVVVRRLTIKGIKDFLQQYGSVKRVKLAEQGNGIKVTHLLFRANGDSTEAQIALPKRGDKHIPSTNNTLKQDVLCRDFTINGMYLPINYSSSKNVIDLVGGRDDISKRRIAPISDAHKCLKDSPIRIMRTISLAARTGYTIDKKLISAIVKHSKLLYKIPIEGIRSEFDKILLSKRPSKYLLLMQKKGVLRRFFGELSACYGVSQNDKYHMYDVFHHCVYACDNAPPDLVLRLAAVLHDTGKAETAEFKGDHITFHMHEVHSEFLAKAFLRRMKYPKELTQNVIHLVKHHMYHYVSDVYKCQHCDWHQHVDVFSDEDQTFDKCHKCGAETILVAGWSDSTIRRFIRKIGMKEEDFKDIGNFPLFKLRIADRLGSGYKNQAVTARQKHFERRLVDVHSRSTALTVKDLDVTGIDIIKMFNIPPSPIIGEVLEHLLSKVLDRPDMNNKRTLLMEATGFLIDKQLYSTPK